MPWALVFLNATCFEAVRTHLRGTSYAQRVTVMGFRGLVAGAIGLSITIAATVDPSVLVDHRAPVLRAILETAIALVGTLVAVLATGRFRRSRSVGDLSIVLAVALLAWVHTLFGNVPDLISPYSVGNGMSERFEVWGTIVVRTLAGGLLLAAGVSHVAKGFRASASRSSYYGLQASIAAGVVAIPLLVSWVPIGQSGLLGQAGWPLTASSILQLPGAVLFFLAFFALSNKAKLQSDSFLGWIAAGCMFGGFAIVSYALLPSGGANWLRSGDILRGGAVCTWAIGAVAEIRSYWSTVARSVREETRRDVALELHDGLAQELALLASYTHSSAAVRNQPEWYEHLQMTAERALAEARRAIAALAADEPVPFEADLEQTAESISNDVKVHVEVDAISGAPAMMDPIQRESIVRIVREAVANAVRHGNAGHIEIRFDGRGSPALRVFDDGVGFDPARLVNSGHFGIVSMRERAESIGASLQVRSAPGKGTLVEVLWP